MFLLDAGNILYLSLKGEVKEISSACYFTLEMPAQPGWTRQKPGTPSGSHTYKWQGPEHLSALQDALAGS